MLTVWLEVLAFLRCSTSGSLILVFLLYLSPVLISESAHYLGPDFTLLCVQQDHQNHLLERSWLLSAWDHPERDALQTQPSHPWAWIFNVSLLVWVLLYASDDLRHAFVVIIFLHYIEVILPVHREEKKNTVVWNICRIQYDLIGEGWFKKKILIELKWTTVKWASPPADDQDDLTLCTLSLYVWNVCVL